MRLGLTYRRHTIVSSDGESLLGSTGHSAPYSLKTYRERTLQKVGVCVTDSLCCTPETETLHISYTLVKF